MNQPITHGTFDDDEVAAMMRATSSNWWRAFIVVSLDTGIRVQEAIRLHVSDVDARTRSIRITSEPPDDAQDPELLSLRRSMPVHRERVLPISSNTLACLSVLRAERTADRHVFVPDWKLDQLWPWITRGDPVTTDMLCPGMHEHFRLIQRRARYQNALSNGVSLAELTWPRRGLPSLRSTAIARLARGMSARYLAEHLGQASTRSMRHACSHASTTKEEAA